jgi:S-adenosylmethionine:tRNA ribosyltransferase-isomerase
MRTDELEYDLPDALIAQVPTEARDGARMLVVDAGQGHTDAHVIDLPDLLPPSLFVVNETRVLPARLRGVKPTGGAVEILLLERLHRSSASQRWHAMGRTSKKLKPGQMVAFSGALEATVLSRREDGTIEVELRGDDVDAAIEQLGEMPLPPYIRRAHDPVFDPERYQTIFASEPGAVAAPTAGLHFTDALVERMRAAGHTFARVVLHVGAGTFRPVGAETLDAHEMHEERWSIGVDAAAAIEDARATGRAVVAVGTTVVRTLESAHATWDARGALAGSGRTRLFIRPPYEPRLVDHVLTNFHLPRSTLLALVMALGGTDTIRNAYRHAVQAQYRFFSYGDAMLIRRPGPKQRP